MAKEYQDFDVLTVGGMVCDFLIQPIPTTLFEHEITYVDSMKTNVGGDAANEAVIMARLGMKVIIGTDGGNDSTGRGLVDYLEQNGVNTGNVILRDGDATRTNVVMIRADGERHFIILNKRTPGFGQDGDWDFGLLDHIRAISVGSIHMGPALDNSLGAYLKAARQKGVITVCDMVTNEYQFPQERLKTEILPYVDYLLPSEIEAEEMTGEKDPKKMAAVIRSWGVKNVVIKLGSKGCYGVNDDAEFELPVYPVSVVDTTGAGDNFTAGFVTAVINGLNFRQCANFASAVGGISTQGVGSTAAVKNMEQVVAFMKQHGRYDF